MRTVIESMKFLRSRRALDGWTHLAFEIAHGLKQIQLALQRDIHSDPFQEHCKAFFGYSHDMYLAAAVSVGGQSMAFLRWYCPLHHGSQALGVETCDTLQVGLESVSPVVQLHSDQPSPTDFSLSLLG